MTWRDRDPALRRRLDENESGTIGAIGPIASDPAPIVPNVPIVQASATADCLAERAAIVEEGAGVPREWAEGFARLEDRPIPRGVNAATWLAMMNAAGRFLDRWGSKAAALGWTAAELFGLDATSPLYRWDRRGAGFYLIDCEIVEVTTLAIKVKKPCGAVQHVYRRKGFTVPAWENFHEE